MMNTDPLWPLFVIAHVGGIFVGAALATLWWRQHCSRLAAGEAQRRRDRRERVERLTTPAEVGGGKTRDRAATLGDVLAHVHRTEHATPVDADLTNTASVNIREVSQQERWAEIQRAVVNTGLTVSEFVEKYRRRELPDTLAVNEVVILLASMGESIPPVDAGGRPLPPTPPPGQPEPSGGRPLPSPDYSLTREVPEDRRR
jgi:hypothetical protein